MEIINRADDGTEFRNQTDCLLHERMSNLSHKYQRYGHYDITDDDQLFTLYVKELNDGLFTDEEMKEMSYTRDEYVQKKYFLENYFILQFH